MKWEDEDKGYPTLSALSALNLNLDLNPAVRPRHYGFWWGLVGDCDYDRRRRTNANPPKPTARSESADGSGAKATLRSNALSVLHPTS